MPDFLSAASVEIVAKFMNQLSCSNSTFKALPETVELRQEEHPPCKDEDLSLDPSIHVQSMHSHACLKPLHWEAETVYPIESNVQKTTGKCPTSCLSHHLSEQGSQVPLHRHTLHTCITYHKHTTHKVERNHCHYDTSQHCCL